MDEIQHKPVFEGVRYWINSSIPAGTRKQLDSLLRLGKGRPASENDGCRIEDLDLRNVTHIITETVYIQRWEEIRSLWVAGQEQDKFCVVSPRWITRSHDLQIRLQSRFFSPEPDKFFSGICICVYGLSDKDAEMIMGAVSAFGGYYRETLCKEVTHLVVMVPKGEIYQLALRYGLEDGMKIILPHWFDDCIKLRERVSDTAYLFPEPSLLNENMWGDAPLTSDLAENKSERSQPSSSTATMKILDSQTRKSQETELYRKIVGQNNVPSNSSQSSAALDTLASTVRSQSHGTDSLELSQKLHPIPDSESFMFFERRKVYLASCLNLRNTLANALVRRIKNADGDVSVGVSIERINPMAAKTKVMESDIVICHRRSGWEYWMAYDAGKIIGSIYWLLHVLQIQRLEPPRARLMHFPFPETQIPNFHRYKMSISNYSGATRDLIRHMIQIMGGQYSGTMDPTHTHLISSAKWGKKVEKAEEWGIAIVNHIWLEECYVKWRDASITREPFLYFNPGINLRSSIAERGLEPGSIETWAAYEEARQDKKRSLELFEEYNKAETDGKFMREVEESPSPVSSRRMEYKDEDKKENSPPISSPPGMSDLFPKIHFSGDVHHEEVLQTDFSRETTIGVEELTNIKENKGLNLIDSAQLYQNDAQYERETNQSNSSDFDRELRIPENDNAENEKQRHSQTSQESEPIDDQLLRSKRKKALKKSLSSLEGDLAESGRKRTKRDLSSKENIRKLKKETQNTNDQQDRRQSRSNLQKTKQSIGKETAANEDEQIISINSRSRGRKSREKLVNEDDEGEALEKNHILNLGRNTPTRNNFNMRKVLTTNVVLKDDIAKAFGKLGVKLTTKPAECTHLVTSKISRTEKFLCALPIAPLIVTEDWIKQSVKAGKLLDEDKFLLKDPEGEKKWKFSLADSLKRAEKSLVLKGMAFFITVNVVPAVPILTKIIKANGGEVSKAAPSLRQLSGQQGRYLISCLEDRKIWGSLVENDNSIKVYAPELILEGCLKQELNFDDHSLL